MDITKKNKFLGWMLSLSGGMFLLFFEFLGDPTLLVRLFFMGGMFLVFFLLFREEIEKEGKGLFPKHSFLWLFIGFLGFTVISSFHALDIGKAIIFVASRFFQLGIILQLLWGWTFLDKKKEAVSFLSLMGWVVLIPGIYQIAPLIMYGDFGHQASYEVHGLFSHRNLYSQILLLLVPIHLYTSIVSKRYVPQALVQLFISFLLIVFLFSRGAWLGLMVFFIVLIPMVFIGRKVTSSSKRSLGKIIGVLALSVVLAVGILYSLGYEDPLLKQLESLFAINYSGGAQRMGLWERSLALFKEAPFLGVGLGNWNLLVGQFGVEGLLSEDNITFFQRPHNDYLWVLAESGIFAFLFFIGAKIYLFFDGFKGVKGGNSSISIWLAALTAFGTVSFFSFPMERPSSFFMEAVILACLWSELGDSYRFRTPKWALGVILAIAISLLGVISVRCYSSYQYAQLPTAKESGNWEKVRVLSEAAENPFYRIDPFSCPLAWYSGLAAFNQTKARVAESEFERSLRYNPYHIHSHNNLAAVYELQMMHDKAQEHFRKALSINPEMPEARLNLSASYFNSRNVPAAYAELRRVGDKMNDNPNFPKVLSSILISYFNLIGGIFETAEEKKVFNGILNDASWRQNTHFKSLENGISLEDQVRLEVEYVLANT